MDINVRIKQLVNYGIMAGLLEEEERIYTTNLLLDVMGLSEYEEPEDVEQEELEIILKDMLDYAFEQHIIDDNGIVTRDLFDTRIMNCLMPRPSQVIKTFKEYYNTSKKKATDYFYKLSQDSDYIRRYRIPKQNMGIWILPLIYPNQKKIQKRLQQQKMLRPAVIQNVFFVKKMKDMQEESTILPARIIGSFPLP